MTDCSGWQDENADVAWALDCLCCCQLWLLQAFAVTHTSPSLYLHLSTIKRLFSEPPTYYQRKQYSKRWKLEINFSQGSVAALGRWGGQINNFCVAYYLNILCAKYCRNQSTYVDTTANWTRDCSFSTHAVYSRYTLCLQINLTLLVVLITVWCHLQDLS